MDRTDLSRPNTWLWTTREGAEGDLVEELSTGRPAIPARVVAPSLVASEGAPPRGEGPLDVTFTRQGFPVRAVASSSDLDALARELADALAKSLDPAHFWTLQTWVPDSEAGNRLAGRATELHARIERLLDPAHPALAARRTSAEGVARHGGALAQVCLAQEDLAAFGVLPLPDALTLRHGGRARMKVSSDAPSRAAMKLEEALDWLGFGPERGELCVDLGAAPGGWTWVLVQRGARVIAVDPGRLRPDLQRRKGVTEVTASAFTYTPKEPVDWLFCDMAWRPVEVARMLAKWARRDWARVLVSNVKLPMKQKAAIVREVREVVHGGGWKRVRTRQLYHDRDEITLTAVR